MVAPRFFEAAVRRSTRTTTGSPGPSYWTNWARYDIQASLDPARRRAAQEQAMLEGMARIENNGYRRLAELGTPFPVSVRTVGGGAGNAAWTRIRARELQIPMVSPRHTEAAYGAALLAAGCLPQ